MRKYIHRICYNEKFTTSLDPSHLWLISLDMPSPLLSVYYYGVTELPPCPPRCLQQPFRFLLCIPFEASSWSDHSYISLTAQLLLSSINLIHPSFDFVPLVFPFSKHEKPSSISSSESMTMLHSSNCMNLHQVKTSFLIHSTRPKIKK